MLLHAAMRTFTFAVMAAWSVGACSTAQMNPLSEDGPAAIDAAAGADAPATDGAAPDGPVADAATDAAVAVDAPAIDAATDAAGTTCEISAGHTVTLDGTGDLAEYPAAQRLVPGAVTAAGDEVGVSWDPTYLYVTVTSDAFVDASKPLHLYLEAAAGALGTAAPSAGKEYGGLTAQVPFTPTHLIAVRRTNDFGSGPYDGIYVAAGTPAWSTRMHALEPGTDVFVSSDNRTISVRAPWSALGGCPLLVRAGLHVVNGTVANEWKDLVPSTHTPWMAPGGGHYEISLEGPAAITSWTLR